MHNPADIISAAQRARLKRGRQFTQLTRQEQSDRWLGIRSMEPQVYETNLQQKGADSSAQPCQLPKDTPAQCDPGNISREAPRGHRLYDQIVAHHMRARAQVFNNKK